MVPGCCSCHHAAMTDQRYNRRQVLAGGLGAAVALGVPASAARRSRRKLVKAAAATPAAGSDLGAVEHVVFLMHENRSFDHYFGTLGGVERFRHAFGRIRAGVARGSQQHIAAVPSRHDQQPSRVHIRPFPHVAGGARLLEWRSDGPVRRHTYGGCATRVRDSVPMTMGYYTGSDIPFYYELAKNFTICDRYFCSVLGPTHPNRLMQMTGTLDPGGTPGGPILTTSSDRELAFTCSWPTMPEVLRTTTSRGRSTTRTGPATCPAVPTTWSCARTRSCTSSNT